jgi:hypothetical protein
MLGTVSGLKGTCDQALACIEMKGGYRNQPSLYCDRIKRVLERKESSSSCRANCLDRF